MKVTAEKIDNQKVVLEIEVAIEDWQKAIEQAVKSIANEVKIPGFRKGKAPRKIIEKTVGKKAILDTAYEKVAPKAFQDALAEEKLELASYPDFETVTVEEDKPLVFKATITPKPEVTLGEYKGLKIEKTSVEVTEEDIEKHIEQMRSRHGQMVEAPEGALVENGDFTTLDFKGFVDGEAFEGGEGKDYPLQIGSNSFIPGFEDQLVGAAIGEEREVNVTFPEEYHAENLAGKPAIFKCTVRSIKKRELPELDDAFAKKVSVFETMDEFREDVKKRLIEASEQKALQERRTACINKATENVTVDIPQVMIEERITQMIQELTMRIEQQGMKLEQYLKYSGMDIIKLREEYRKTAEQNVKTDLMLEEVARVEEIKLTDADFEAEILMMANSYGATPQQVRKVIQEQGRVTDLAITILRRKTAKFIVDSMTE